MREITSVVIALIFLPLSAAIAQTTSAPPGGTVTVTAQSNYEAHGLKEQLLGSGWRDLWTKPVRIPVLDFNKFAGGVEVGDRGGGRQSLSIRLKERGGWREYGFKSVDKFPVSMTMPDAIKGTTVGSIIQDQVTTLLPGAPSLVSPIMDAIHALNVPGELYVMPDDPRLGSARDTFALMFGEVELSPQEGPNDSPGFAGSKSIKGGDKFLEDVQEERENRLDERELFAVRLVDFIINDNDRSVDNIRFARFGEKGNYTWRPIARDRDRAFTNGTGWLIRYVINPIYPKYVPFNEEFPLAGLVWESWPIDRRLLQRIDRTQANEIARRVQSQVTDGVIEQVINRLPREWRETDAPALMRRVMRARRDSLIPIANEFYSWLATEVDVHGTDEAERADIERAGDGAVTVTLTGRDDSNIYYRRTFLPDETKEVRVYLHDGKDIATVRGASTDDIVVRIIGGKGDDELVDGTSGSGVHLYDFEGDNRFVTARHTSVSEKEWDPPKPGLGVRLDSPWRPDWGKSFSWGPTVDFVHGGGLIIGAGPRYLSYGFRQLPYRTKASANFLLGTSNGRPGVNFDIDHRTENSPLEYNLAARATRYEGFSFYGFGNNTPKISSRAALVNQNLVAIEPLAIWNVGWRTREQPGGNLVPDSDLSHALLPWFGKVKAGPTFYWTKATAPHASPFANESGDNTDSFSRAGARAAFEVERVPRGSVPDRGVRLESELTAYPAILDVNKSFGTAQGAAMGYVPLGKGMHIGLRAGGAIASDEVPLLHAPAIGGRETVRGYSWRRFAGDRLAFGSAELRVPVGKVPVLVRWNVGAFGLVDAGRVWFDDEENQGGWHRGIGGGLWFSSLGQTFSIAYARGSEGHLYLTKGMSF